MKNGPLFSYTNPPHEIDLTLGEVQSYSDDNELRIFSKNLRLFILDTWESNLRHPLPFGNKDEYKILADIRKFIENKKWKIGHEIENGNYIINNQFGTTIIDFWFPELAEAHMLGQIPIMEKIKKDFDHFHTIIRDNVYYNKPGFFGDNIKNKDKKVLPTLFGNAIKHSKWNQVARNFNPKIAKFIYMEMIEKYFPDVDRLFILDPCMGWGGRLLGLIGANEILGDSKKITLIGTDVNSKTHNRFQMINDYIIDNIINTYVSTNPFYGHISKGIEIRKYLTPAEDLHKNKDFNLFRGKGNIVFTSPPYFNKEIYSHDENQSALKFNVYEDWVENFLIGLISNSYKFLKIGGVMLLNIADINQVGKSHPLIEDTKRIADSMGFKLDGIIKMLSPQQFNKGSKKINPNQDDVFDWDIYEPIIDDLEKNIVRHKGKKYKFEPIFIFKKIK